MYFASESHDEAFVDKIQKIEFYNARDDEDGDLTAQASLKSTLHPALRDFQPQHHKGQTWKYKFPKIEYEKDDDDERFVSAEAGFGTEDGSLLTFSELAFRLTVLNAAIRLTLYLYAEREDIWGGDYDFLTPRHFQLPRPVDLNPIEVRRKLQTDGYHFPSHVIDAVCTSLNAGKHVILTGPPGCGKSKLAIEISKQGSTEKMKPLVATASPAWSTNEVIGRYLPRRDGKGLEFDPGFFLRAIDDQDQRWLVLDELNRADIDSAFGELFSVLAGDVTDIPYREYTDEGRETDLEDDGSADEAQTGPQRVRIVPFGASGGGGRYREYHVPQSFRLLATMNDADRSRLHQLSYAFQRRFNIVRIEAPSPSVIRKKIIKDRIIVLGETYEIAGNRSTCESYYDQVDEDADSYQYGIKVDGKNRHWLALNNERFVTVLQKLFAAQESTGTGNFKDFVAERIVGLSAVIDTIEFLADALRAPSDDADDRELVCNTNESSRTIAEEFGLSFLALGISMNVIPQLEQLTSRPDKLQEAIRFLFEIFGKPQRGDGTKPRFWRIASKSDDDGEQEDSDQYDHLDETGKSINEFLAEEIALQLGYTGNDHIDWESFTPLLDDAPDIF